jgi:hypothetical protein
MRFKNQTSFSKTQVSEVLRITRLGSGLIKNEKFAYAMFCSESDFKALFPKLDFQKLRAEIIEALFLNKNKTSLTFACLLSRAGYREFNKPIDLKILRDLDDVYSNINGDSGSE